MLTAIVVWCIFYGRMPSGSLALLCCTLGIALAVTSRHSHTHFFTIDVLAQTSRLNSWNPDIKFWTVIGLLLLCVASQSPIPGAFLTIIMLAMSVFAGGIRLSDYVHLMALPVSFLLLGGLALVLEITHVRTGIGGIPVLGSWICITGEAQSQAALVIMRALGAVSCLYFLSLSTPVHEITGTLRRARLSHVLVELMYLIYRYIFVLLSLFHTMNDAARSRLGYVHYRASVRTTGSLYSNLLAKSYRQAGQNFDAMESRCYDKEIRFFEEQKKITGMQVAFVLCVTAATIGLTIWF
jgi:cobalt/nickel transport system permease protein